MPGCNPENERIKRRYFHHLREGEGLAESTINNARLAITSFEQFSGWANFGTFRQTDAIRYRKALLSGRSKRQAELSSRATVNTKLQQTEKFFRWLSTQPGFKKAITKDAFECLGLSRRDKRIALRAAPRPTPSVEQVRQAILAMPTTTPLRPSSNRSVAPIPMPRSIGWRRCWKPAKTRASSPGDW